MIRKYRTKQDLLNNGINIEYANFFIQEEYLKFLAGNRYSYYFLASDKRVIPVIVYNKYFFKWALLSSEPFIFCQENLFETEMEFLDELTSTLSDYGVQWIDATPAYSLFTSYPPKSIRIPFGSHIINLENEEDVIFKSFRNNYKNNIRRAISDGVIVKKGGKELLNDFISLDVSTWKRSLRKGNKLSYYEQLLNHFPNNVLIYIAYINDIPQNSLMVYFTNAMTYYMFGGSIDNANMGSGKLLHWETIKDMKSLGVKSYSFVGCRINVDKNSKYNGIQNFKAGFGGDLFEGFMFKCVLKPFFYKLFKLLTKIKYSEPSHSPLDEERSKWKSIN